MNIAFKKQQGSVILITLAIVILMTIWGLTAVKNTSFMLQGNHNARLKQLSHEAAEYALRQSESMVRADVSSFADIETKYSGENGRYSLVRNIKPLVDFALLPLGFDYKNPDHWLKEDWEVGDNRPGFSYLEIIYDDDSKSKTKMLRQPRVVIEYIGRDQYDKNSLPNPKSRQMFRVTAIGWGPQGVASTVLRSHVAVPAT